MAVFGIRCSVLGGGVDFRRGSGPVGGGDRTGGCRGKYHM